MSSIYITLAVIFAVGVGSAFTTFTIWNAECRRISDMYDRELRKAYAEIKALTESNSHLQAQLVESHYRNNNPQSAFYDMPSKKEYRENNKSLFAEW